MYVCTSKWHMLCIQERKCIFVYAWRQRSPAYARGQCCGLHALCAGDNAPHAPLQVCRDACAPTMVCVRMSLCACVCHCVCVRMSLCVRTNESVCVRMSLCVCRRVLQYWECVHASVIMCLCYDCICAQSFVQYHTKNIIIPEFSNY